MIAAFTHLRRFQGRADFLTWATRILINAAMQQIRRTRAKPTVSWEQVVGQREGASCEEYLRDPQPTPEEKLREKEQREILADALGKLPVESLQAIQLCQFAENPLKEAANTLGVPVSTLKTRLHRARRALGVHLKRKTQSRRAKPHKQSVPRFATVEHIARPRDVGESSVATGGH